MTGNNTTHYAYTLGGSIRMSNEPVHPAHLMIGEFTLAPYGTNSHAYVYRTYSKQMGYPVSALKEIIEHIEQLNKSIEENT